MWSGDDSVAGRKRAHIVELLQKGNKFEGGYATARRKGLAVGRDLRTRSEKGEKGIKTTGVAIKGIRTVSGLAKTGGVKKENMKERGGSRKRFANVVQRTNESWAAAISSTRLHLEMLGAALQNIEKEKHNVVDEPGEVRCCEKTLSRPRGKRKESARMHARTISVWSED